ncbi:hypothetical protein [Demequina rhizosphaerae]|uniref:hypothetical protein n=1 Tax=Demequina rhizosphaerae TaxID=1638985 RepID=UPI00078287A1|nr:hypothetical protein [Demequina rhizosphaerae]
MAHRTLKRALATGAAVVGLTVAVAAPGSAQKPTDKYEYPAGRLYDNHITSPEGLDDSERDLLLFAGMSPAVFCSLIDADPDNDVPPELADELDRMEKDGVTIHERYVNQRASLEVYDGGGLGLFEWAAGEYCPALEAGGALPEPVATGVGVLLDKSVVDISGLVAPAAGEDPTVWIDSKNSVRGTVVTSDGERWVVRGSSVNSVELTFGDGPEAPPTAQDEYPELTMVEVLNRR